MVFGGCYICKTGRDRLLIQGMVGQESSLVKVSLQLDSPFTVPFYVVVVRMNSLQLSGHSCLVVWDV